MVQDSRDLHGVDGDGGVVVDAVLLRELLPEVVRQLQTQLTPVRLKFIYSTIKCASV